MKLLITLLLTPCITYAGMFLDKPTKGNISYLSARYLNHTTGRFITQDIEQQYDSHYSYGIGRVIISSDPTGMMWQQQFEDSANIAEYSYRADMESISKEILESTLETISEEPLSKLSVTNGNVTTVKHSSHSQPFIATEGSRIVAKSSSLDQWVARNRLDSIDTKPKQAEPYNGSTDLDEKNIRQEMELRIKSKKLISMTRSIHLSIVDNMESDNMDFSQIDSGSRSKVRSMHKDWHDVVNRYKNFKQEPLDTRKIDDFYKRLDYNSVTKERKIRRLARQYKMKFEDMNEKLKNYYMERKLE